jgi:hypothetical protein
MHIWRKLEFRGRDRHGNPFVDFGLVEVEHGRFALTSHVLRQPLWVESAAAILPQFKRYFEAQGFARLRYKVLWDEAGPLDTPFEEGWQDL